MNCQRICEGSEAVWFVSLAALSVDMLCRGVGVLKVEWRSVDPSSALQATALAELVRGPEETR